MRLRFDQRNADGSYTLTVSLGKHIAQCGQRLPALECAAPADDFVIPGQEEKSNIVDASYSSGELVWFSSEGALPAPAQKGWYVARLCDNALYVLAYLTCSGYAYTCHSFIYELPDTWDMCLTQTRFEDIAQHQFDTDACDAQREPVLSPLLLGASIPQHISYAAQREMLEHKQEKDLRFYQEHMVPRAFMRDLEEELHEATLIARSSEFDVAACLDEKKRVPHVFARGTTNTLENIVATAASWCDKAFYAHHAHSCFAGEYTKSDVFEVLCSKASFTDEGQYAHATPLNNLEQNQPKAAHSESDSPYSEHQDTTSGRIFVRNPFTKTLCEVALFTCNNHIFTCMYSLFKAYTRLRSLSMPSFMAYAYCLFVQRSREAGCLPMYTLPTTLCNSLVENFQESFVRIVSMLSMPRYDTELCLAPAYTWLYSHLKKTRARWLYFPSLLGEYFIQHDGFVPYKFSIRPANDHAYDTVLTPRDMLEIESVLNAFGALVRRFGDTLVLFNEQEFKQAARGVLYSVAWDLKPVKPLNEANYNDGTSFDISPIDQIHALVRSINPYSAVNHSMLLRAQANVYARYTQESLNLGTDVSFESFYGFVESDACKAASSSAWNLRRRFAHVMATLPSVFRYFSYFKCDNSFHDVDFYYIALDESMMSPWFDALADCTSPSAFSTTYDAAFSGARAENAAAFSGDHTNDDASCVPRTRDGADKGTKSSLHAAHDYACLNELMLSCTSDTGMQALAQRLARLLGLAFAARAFVACPLLQRVHVHAYKKRWDVLSTSDETHEEFSDTPWFEYTFLRTQFSSTRAYSAAYTDPQWLFAAFAPYFKVQEQSSVASTMFDFAYVNAANTQSSSTYGANHDMLNADVSSRTPTPSCEVSPSREDSPSREETLLIDNTTSPDSKADCYAYASLSHRRLPPSVFTSLGATYADDLAIHFCVIDDAHIASISNAIASKHPLSQIISSIQSLSCEYEQKYEHDSFKRSIATRVFKTLMERLVRDDALECAPVSVLRELLDGAHVFRSVYHKARVLRLTSPADAYKLLLQTIRNNKQATFMLDYHGKYCHKAFYSYSERLLYNLAHAQLLFLDQPALGGCDNKYRVFPAPVELHACFVEMIRCATRIPVDAPFDKSTSYDVITLLMEYTLKFAPFHVDGYISVALCMLHYERCNDAIETLRRALQFAWKPSSVGTCYYVLACAYARKGNDELSAICYKKALEFNVDYSTLDIQPTLRASIGAHIARFSHVYTDDVLALYHIPVAANQQVLDAFLRGGEAACKQNLLQAAHDILQDYLDYSGDSILTSVCNSCLENTRSDSIAGGAHRSTHAKGNENGDTRNTSA